MDMALNILSWIAISMGAFFMISGGIGLVRLPDFYTRGHAAGMTDTMGIFLIFVGLLFQAPDHIAAAKLIFILLFQFFVGPTASHALAKAAWTAGIRPKGTTDLRSPERKAAGEEEV